MTSSLRSGRVLVIGAAGFIGSAVVAAFHRAGFETRCAVRDAKSFGTRFPQSDTRHLDLTSGAAREAGVWAELLDGMDAVVNAAGVLQPARSAEAWAVHRDAPDALYAACEKFGVRRIVHVSSLGIAESETTYARSKRAGEQVLMTRDLDWTILRPAFVIGETSYGGTSLLRALAVMPFATPVIGDGEMPVDTIHVDDLAGGIVELVKTGRGASSMLEPAGPDRRSFAELIAAYRNWFGLRPQRMLRIPIPLATLAARIGDVTRLHPVTSTMLALYRARITGDAAGFEAATDVPTRGLRDILAARPSATQDLWHARLYLWRPVIRFGLAFLWAMSGVAMLTADSATYEALFGLLKPGGPAAVGGVACAANLVIALALLLGWQLKRLAWLQAATIVCYSASLGIFGPDNSHGLLGALLGNLAVLFLVLVHRILEEER